MISYNGIARVGINLDIGAVRDPQLLVHCLQGAYQDLIAAGRPHSIERPAPQSAAG